MTAIERTGQWRPGRPEYAIVVVAGVLTALGLVMVYSSSFVIGLARFGDGQYYVVRQAMWAALGLVLMVAAMRTDYRVYRTLALPIMGGTIAALLAVLVVGQEAGGAKRWLGMGEFSVQPAEFAKLTVIIYVAAWLVAKGSSIRSMQNGLLPFVFIVGSVGVLIMMQPNLGTTAIIVITTVVMFWVAGATIAQMATLGATVVAALVFLATTEGYRMNRILAFLDAERDPLGHGFQTLQALIALGHGGPTGVGLGASRGKFFYIPESHTDGVFAVLGEELGLVGTASVLLLLLLLMMLGYQAARRARDQFGLLVATGITTWLTAQALINIGGIVRLIPLTGVPLPFLSYGGSALAAELLALGVLVNISRFGRDRGGYLDREHAPTARRQVIRRRTG